MTTPTPSATYLDEVVRVASSIDPIQLEQMAAGLARVREGGGRLFIIGVGGGAGHASHAVNDFRKICHLESYTPTDNVSELTARVNDDGWDTTFEAWLATSRIGDRDAMLVFSVGGGSREHSISMNIVLAVEHANRVGAKIYGIVGKPDGVTAQLADVCIVVDTVAALRTGIVEGFQAVLWHGLVFHPLLEAQPGKWEEVESGTQS
ncbi:MAG TPA: SIS domain-containing protein [Jatrophihabitans sp.]|jgi:D-sedoheptulose 7-phosphate isomerase